MPSLGWIARANGTARSFACGVLLLERHGRCIIGAMNWIDVSVTLHNGMVHWPDNPPVRIEHALDLEHGDACTVSNLSFGAHTGTHVDAPAHFVSGGSGSRRYR